MTPLTQGISTPSLREVVIGRNSRVWKAAERNAMVAARFGDAISHGDLPRFAFTPHDRVWVFSYSRVAMENSRLLQILRSAGVAEIVYVSTATTNVTRVTKCYEYPRVKQAAEDEARQLLNARILTLGVVVDSLDELPPGRIAATLQGQIDEFLLQPSWRDDGGTRTRLFEIRVSPFTRAWEARLYCVYNAVQWALRRNACVLRPVDLVLRALGVRWYGYVNLSNRLWTTTTS